MEERGEPENINIRMLLNELTQALHRIFMRLGLSHIKGDLMLHILPVIYNSVIHMYRIPHNIGKKTYCIIMKCLCTVDCHIPTLAVIAPLLCRNYFSRGTVNHFPPSCDIIMVIDLQHIRIQMVHQMNG